MNKIWLVIFSLLLIAGCQSADDSAILEKEEALLELQEELEQKAQALTERDEELAQKEEDIEQREEALESQAQDLEEREEALQEQVMALEEAQQQQEEETDQDETSESNGEQENNEQERALTSAELEYINALLLNVQDIEYYFYELGHLMSSPYMYSDAWIDDMAWVLTMLDALVIEAYLFVSPSERFDDVEFYYTMAAIEIDLMIGELIFGIDFHNADAIDKATDHLITSSEYMEKATVEIDKINESLD